MIVNHLLFNFNSKNYPKVHQSLLISFLISHYCLASMFLLAFYLWWSTSWVLSGVCTFRWDSGTNLTTSFHLKLQLNLCSVAVYTVFSASKMLLLGIFPHATPSCFPEKASWRKMFLYFYLHSSQARIRFLH